MPEWQEFEQAVAKFVSSLDPNSQVRHNVLLPDRHTGRPRQRDVWVDTTVCRILPIQILISCKKWKRKIHQGDMDAFIGELQSSGAHKGVLYSYSGFTVPAVEKGKALGISCCKLYPGEPAEIPESLLLNFYCCTPSFRIRLNDEAMPEWGPRSFGEVFDLPTSDDDADGTALDMLCEAFSSNEKTELARVKKSGPFPKSWSAGIEICLEEFKTPLRISLEGMWRIFRLKLEANLLNGTYSFTESQFVGSQMTPWLDLQGPDPGPHWELQPGPPDPPEPNIGVVILSGGNVKEMIKKRFPEERISDLSSIRAGK